jgi:transketolase
MFLYAWLNLSGYDVSIEDIKRFRQLHSKTPGHPEYLKRRESNAPLVRWGKALAMRLVSRWQRKWRRRISIPASIAFSISIFFVWREMVVSRKACRRKRARSRGHFGLDNLILIYDSNAITLDAMAKQTQSEDTRKRL